MKKSIIAFSLLFVSISMASSYDVRYYLDKKSITFKESISSELPEVPIYGEWTNYGTPYDCSVWTPSANTVTTDTTFTQNQSCNQIQKRTVNNGQLPDESQVIVISNYQTVNGKLSCSTYGLGVNGFVSYGAVSNITLENPNYGARISWNSQLVYSDLDPTFKPDRKEITVGQFVYVRTNFISSRNINFNSYNYKTYDYSVCRYPL